MEKSDKEEIFNDLKLNVMTAGTDNKIIIQPETHFGIYGNHSYDFVNCIKGNKELFFYLWNPHGFNKKLNNDYNNIDENILKFINEINL